MGALDGTLVVSIEQAVAAPLCTARLAEAGARVIKIERAKGETARHYDASVKGNSAYFVWLNSGKESVVLDLKTKGDMGLLRRILSRADVFVQNLAPGAVARLGLDWNSLRRMNPKLIFVSICGYGQDTDYAQMRAYDMLVQAESGLCSVTGTTDAPAKVGVSVGDIATGSNAHAAILEALLDRAKTGRGQAVEIAMFDSLADWMSVPLLHYEHARADTLRHGLAHASIYPYRPFACSDGALVIAVQNNEEWDRFCREVLDSPDIAIRPEFSTNRLRVENRDALDEFVTPCFAEWTVTEAQRRCAEARIAWAVYRTVPGLSEHPALRRREVTLPGGEVVTLPLSGGRGRSEGPGPVPDLGANTEQVRREFGG